MLARLRLWWKKVRKHPLVIGLIALIVVSMPIFLGYRLDWHWTGFSNKTLWDWLNLLGALAIPAVVGLGAAWYTAQQGKVSERENTDNQREAALQAYIDKMSELLLEKKLRESGEKDEVRTIARVRTLAVLPRLDGKRKGSVVQFLYESSLIGKDKRIVDLSKADLRGAYLEGTPLDEAILRGAYLEGTPLFEVGLARACLNFVNLERAHLRGANLREADLTCVNLDGADLRGAYLNGANLSGADLWRADLSGARLKGANLRGADLWRANLSEVYLGEANLSYADLSGADLRGAFLSNEDLTGVDLWRADLRGAYLNGANLSEAYLNEADLRRAYLNGANLTCVNLDGVDLSGADLSGARLKGATGITLEELKKRASSLKDTIMPDGSVHP